MSQSPRCDPRASMPREMNRAHGFDIGKHP